MSTRWHVLGTWLLAIILGWAGVMKALNPAAFAGAIAGFRLVPWPVGAALSLYLPWLEIVTAGALLIPRWRYAGLCIATMLSVGFVILWAITLGRGLNVACGCFGGGGVTDNVWALGRAVVLAALTGVLLKVPFGSGPS